MNNMSKPVNIMDTLTPKPPFNPARKNKAVDFGKPKFVSLKAKKLRV